MVRQIAYEIYLRRINEGHPGDDYSDWMQAERELEKLTGDPSDVSRSKAMVRREHFDSYDAIAGM